MSEPKFTKGPWKLFNEKGDIVSIKTGDLIVKWDACHTEEQQLADSALIAAAPEMYASLESIKEKLDRSIRYCIAQYLRTGYSLKTAKHFNRVNIEFSGRIKRLLKKARGE